MSSAQFRQHEQQIESVDITLRIVFQRAEDAKDQLRDQCTLEARFALPLGRAG